MVIRRNTRECSWVEPGGRIQLEHLDAAGEVWLVPASGGRPAGVAGPNGRASVSVLMVAPVSSVLPLLGDGGWLSVSSCSVDEAGDVVPSTNPFERTTVLHRSALGVLTEEETVPLRGIPDTTCWNSKRFIGSCNVFVATQHSRRECTNPSRKQIPGSTQSVR